MLSIKSTFNVPAYVLGACVLCAVALNVVSWKQGVELAKIDAEKKGVVTRLLIDR